MKFIRTGLTARNLSSLLHDFIYVRSEQPLRLSGFDLNQSQSDGPKFSVICTESLKIEAKNNVLVIESPKGISENCSSLLIRPIHTNGKIIVDDNSSFANQRVYVGELKVMAQMNQIRVILQCPTEEYVKSVIKAEMPANYNLEALKAQAICARTYAMHPRVNHQKDFCDVCDSYLCCQAFSGLQANINPRHKQASDITAGEILTYNDESILCLFSSCAGGHTENYQDCFSDWSTGLFPPQPLPYLKGIEENWGVNSQSIDESGLKRLWHGDNKTFDSGFPQFRWSATFSIEDLESTMHHSLSQLLERKEFASFITPPPSEVFGILKTFRILKRGVGGTIIELEISTSKGDWFIKKELTIRNLFKSKNNKFKILPSAKIFLDQTYNDGGELLSIVLYGLGHGHGVGMQQVGAQGLANLGKNYREILSHYYAGAIIDKA